MSDNIKTVLMTNITLRVSTEEIEELDKYAEQQCRTRSGLIRSLIRAFLNQQRQGHP